METDNVGPLYGVHMVVNTEPLEKGKTYGSSGLKVILHQHEELPLKRVGFHVPPGYVTYVDMKKQKVFFSFISQLFIALVTVGLYLNHYLYDCKLDYNACHERSNGRI